jgi:hypothetical protein
MESESDYTVEHFTGNLKDVSNIQKSFIVRDVKFIYFRKGEAENNILIAYLITLVLIAWHFLKSWPEFKEGTKVFLEDLKNIADKCIEKFKGAWPSRPDCREIACPEDPIIKETLEILKRLGIGVRYLKNEQRGKFRYFVNDKKYCLFVRRNDGIFTGMIGNNPEMILCLKETFENEWEEIESIQNEIINSDNAE